MRYLWQFGIYTRADFDKYKQLQLEMFGENSYEVENIADKLRAHTERASYGHRKSTPKGHHKNMKNDFNEFDYMFKRSRYIQSTTLTGRWTWKPRCPKCNKFLILFKFTFGRYESHVYDTCFNCRYAKEYSKDEALKADNPEYSTLRRKPIPKKPIPKFGDDLSKFPNV